MSDTPKRKKKLLPAILRVCVISLAAVVLGVNIYNWNAKSLTGNVLPMPFGYGGAVVLSGSMEPAILTDELIIVKAEDSYAEGDIVVYQSGKMLVVHRLVAIDGESAVTRGDANNTDDAPIELSQIKGRVIYHIPRVGVLVRLLKTPVATVILLAAAVLSVELSYRKEKEKKSEELERIKAEIRRLKEEQESG